MYLIKYLYVLAEVHILLSSPAPPQWGEENQTDCKGKKRGEKEEKRKERKGGKGSKKGGKGSEKGGKGRGEKRKVAKGR